MGKTVRARFMKTWKGENSELGRYVRLSETKLISVSVCG